MSGHTSLFRFSLLTAVAAAAALLSAQSSPAPTQSTIASLTVKGDVTTPLTLKAEDLAKMPRESATVDDQDGSKIEYEGVPLREILKAAGAPVGNQLRGKALASYVLAVAHDGYEVVFTLAELDASFANEKILVADKRDGKPLFGYQGPFRLVCPGDKAGARSVRMLDRLEVVRLQK